MHIVQGAYTDIERDFIDNEPPGLFPTDQSSVWGQVRSVYGAYLQTLADMLTKWYGNLDPATVSDDDLPEWEEMLNLPAGNTTLTTTARRANIIARFQRGPFTRTRRRLLVESFITPTFGTAISFDPTGVPFVSAGIPFFSGTSSLTGTYNIVENIPAFSYQVRILNTITVDTIGMTRELTRITPAGIAFTILSTATP
jgi:hypothetical protein